MQFPKQLLTGFHLSIVPISEPLAWGLEVSLSGRTREGTKDLGGNIYVGYMCSFASGCVCVSLSISEEEGSFCGVTPHQLPGNL